MPNYEYACVTCDRTETLNRPVDLRDAPVPCHICGYNMVRIWTSVPIQFKGSGFYTTDKGAI